MKLIFYKLMLTMIVFAGLMIGIVKGQEARQKWVTKKKSRYEQKNHVAQNCSENALILLDEFEMAAYHQ